MKMEREEDYICSLSWTKEGSYLAVGTSDCKVQVRVEIIVPLESKWIWDISEHVFYIYFFYKLYWFPFSCGMLKIRSACAAWPATQQGLEVWAGMTMLSPGKNVSPTKDSGDISLVFSIFALKCVFSSFTTPCSGSRSGHIHHHDVRVADHHIGTLTAHAQEVCGLKWSPDGRYLASGGNDNLVCIWPRAQGGSAGNDSQLIRCWSEHQGAVKVSSKQKFNMLIFSFSVSSPFLLFVKI